MERQEPSGPRTVLMNAEHIAAAIRDIALRIIEDCGDIETVALLGILRRGRPLADRLADAIEAACGARPKVGSLATTLYRDDVRSGVRGAKRGAGETYFDFRVDDVTVVLVDDVISTGRTVRAAIDEVIDYGRPKRIRLACLVDRGLRELPIRPDYLGRSLPTNYADHVMVRLQEFDGEDAVLLVEGDALEDTDRG